MEILFRLKNVLAQLEMEKEIASAWDSCSVKFW